MIILRRIPMTALQTGLFNLLSDGQTTPVIDNVPEDAVLPYIQIGAFTCKNISDKTTDIWDCSIQINIFSDYKGKAEINNIANDIVTVLSSTIVDMSADKFIALSLDVDFFETWQEEEFGYRGVVTIVVKVQNVGA
jgi:hypothetical protein